MFLFFSKKNIFCGLSFQCPWPQRELQLICLLRQSFGLSRKVSGPEVGTVVPVQILIWPFFSL